MNMMMSAPCLPTADIIYLNFLSQAKYQPQVIVSFTHKSHYYSNAVHVIIMNIKSKLGWIIIEVSDTAAKYCNNLKTIELFDVFRTCVEQKQHPGMIYSA